MPGNTLAVRLELPERVAAGTRVAGRLTLTNAGERAVAIVAPSYNAALNIAVFDALWNDVAPRATGKAHAAYDRSELAPGASQTFELHGLAYITGTAALEFALRAGVYHVVAVYHPPSAPMPAGAAYPVAVASNVVTLTVE